MSSRHPGRMSVRGLDPTCPSSIKREPSSPSSQGDVSPAHPSPGSSSSDTNSSYGPLTKGLNPNTGLDSPGLYGHTAGLANNEGTNRFVYKLHSPPICLFYHIFFTMSKHLPPHLIPSVQEVWGGWRPSEVWIHAGFSSKAAVFGVWWRGLRLPLWCGLVWSLQSLL